MILLAACNEPSVQTATESSPRNSTNHANPEVTENGDSMNLTQQLEFSKQDLVQRLGIEPEQPPQMPKSFGPKSSSKAGSG